MRQLMLVKHQARGRESVLWSQTQQGTQVQTEGDAGVVPVVDDDEELELIVEPEDTVGASSGAPMEA